nr:hypothetical protein BaRGS_013981 [Batillaria attramentaria]
MARHFLANNQRSRGICVSSGGGLHPCKASGVFSILDNPTGLGVEETAETRKHHHHHLPPQQVPAQETWLEFSLLVNFVWVLELRGFQALDSVLEPVIYPTSVECLQVWQLEKLLWEI